MAKAAKKEVAVSLETVLWNCRVALRGVGSTEKNRDAVIALVFLKFAGDKFEKRRAELIEQYGDRFGFVGGFDSNGPVAREGATIEEVESEVARCLDTYGKYHRGYCFFGFRYPDSLDPKVVAAYMAPIAQKATEYSFELMMAGK
mgnify:CR=1 FL=1